MVERKICSGCGVEKELTDFPGDVTRVVKKGYQCRSCHNRRGREYYKKNSGQHREKHLLRKYGLSLEQFADKLKQQDGKCPCCGETATAVDHCHTTNQVRDLLCLNCNAALGLVFERTEVLKNMISYLDKW